MYYLNLSRRSPSCTPSRLSLIWSLMQPGSPNACLHVQGGKYPDNRQHQHLGSSSVHCLQNTIPVDCYSGTCAFLRQAGVEEASEAAVTWYRDLLGLNVPHTLRLHSGSTSLRSSGVFYLARSMGTALVLNRAVPGLAVQHVRVRHRPRRFIHVSSYLFWRRRRTRHLWHCLSQTKH